MNTTGVNPIRLLACALVMLTGAAGFCQTGNEETLVSLEVQNESLGAVLDRIGADTGYRFRIDERWTSVPVSARLNQFPLDRALKRVLREFDNIIIYHPDRVIEIRVFGMADNEAKRAARDRPYLPPIVPPVQETEVAEPLDEPAAAEAETASDSQESGPRSTGEPASKKTIESTGDGLPEDKMPGGAAAD